MGYTHKFTQKKPPTPAQWKTITTGFKKLMAAALLTQTFPIQYEDTNPAPPEITDECIRFNGIGDAGHETMLLEHDEPGSYFCKTNRKPYDRAVMALLITAHQDAGQSALTVNQRTGNPPWTG